MRRARRATSRRSCGRTAARSTRRSRRASAPRSPVPPAPLTAPGPGACGWDIRPSGAYGNHARSANAVPGRTPRQAPHERQTPREWQAPTSAASPPQAANAPQAASPHERQTSHECQTPPRVRQAPRRRPPCLNYRFRQIRLRTLSAWTFRALRSLEWSYGVRSELPGAHDAPRGAQRDTAGADVAGYEVYGGGGRYTEGGRARGRAGPWAGGPRDLVASPDELAVSSRGPDLAPRRLPSARGTARPARTRQGSYQLTCPEQ
jgi:hypothetical protein